MKDGQSNRSSSDLGPNEPDDYYIHYFYPRFISVNKQEDALSFFERGFILDEVGDSQWLFEGEKYVPPDLPLGAGVEERYDIDSRSPGMEAENEEGRTYSDNEGITKEIPRGRTYNLRPKPSRKARLLAQQTHPDGNQDD